MKKLSLFLLILLLTSCSDQNNKTEKYVPEADYAETVYEVKDEKAEISLVNKDENILASRFLPPEGYERMKAEKGTFESYLSSLPLKPYGARVHYYNGQEKTKDVYATVVDMDIGTRDLQQCADAVMRLRAEFLYSAGQYDKIHFNLTNGFRADFLKWAAGSRITVTGNKTAWVKKTGYSDSYENFRKYMDFIFAYAGTLSLEKELAPVSINEMKIGDVFIKGGSPGHCVIVVDMSENPSTGEKLFMLAQSYMPAQDIQILKNNNDSEISPWYPAAFGDTLETPEWLFSSGDLKRFED